MLGNQTTRQIQNKLTVDALLSTSIKLANVREQDGARLLAESIGYLDENDRPNFRPFMARPAFNFLYHDPDLPEPIPYKFKPGVLEAEPAMTEEEWQEVYADIRDRYYEPINRQGSTTPAQAEIAATPRHPTTPRPAPTPDPPVVEGSEGAPVWDNDVM